MPTFPERRVLLTAAEIAQRVKSLAAEIAAEIALQNAGEPLVLVCVLESARIFTKDLQKSLEVLGVETKVLNVSASSYGNGTESNGDPTYSLPQNMAAEIKGRKVLVVDDMIDTGTTLQRLVELLHALEPASVNVAVLLEKIKQACEIAAKIFVGFRIPDLWVDGYGIDTGGENRELEHIVAVLLKQHDMQLYNEFRAQQASSIPVVQQ